MPDGAGMVQKNARRAGMVQENARQAGIIQENARRSGHYTLDASSVISTSSGRVLNIFSTFIL